MRLQSLPFCCILLSYAILCPLSADDEEAAPAPAAELDLGDEPVFGGTVRFLDSSHGDLYREGLAHLKARRYDDALKAFTSGRRGVREKSEVEIFSRLTEEARAGVELEKIRKASYRGGKKGAERALALLDRERRKVEKLALAKEYDRLSTEISEFLFVVIDDFESPEAEEKPETSGPGGEPPPPGRGEPGGRDEPGGRGAEGGRDGGDEGGDTGGRRGGRRGGLRGRFGRGFRQGLDDSLAGGRNHSGKDDPSTVREGKQSYEWPIAGDLAAKVFEIRPELLADYSELQFSIRGTSSKTATSIEVLLVDRIDPFGLARGAYDGYRATITVRGTAWKDYRFTIGKELEPKGEPKLEAMHTLLLLVRNQPEQTVYLDAVRLAR